MMPVSNTIPITELINGTEELQNQQTALQTSIMNQDHYPLKLESADVKIAAQEIPPEATQRSPENPSTIKPEVGDIMGIPTRRSHYQDRTGEGPSTDKDLLGIPSIRTYYPTEEEFRDPYSYIEKLERLERKCGAVKIVPPPSWDPQFALDLKKFKFRAVKQSLKQSTTNYDGKVEFYRDLLNFHTERGQPLVKLPSIDKKVLDLYSLRNSVRAKGGFQAVCSKKLWAQIGRELGYTGRIMTSLSSSLKIAYMKTLTAYEEYVASKTNGDQTQEPSSDTNGDNKRPLEQETSGQEVTSKRLKKSPEIALISNSRLLFGRQKDLLKAKGFRTNFESYTEEKQGITLADDETYPFYDFYYWHRGLEVFDCPYPSSDVTREYNFQQFFDIHLKNSKLLSGTDEETVVSEFWRIVKEKDNLNVESAFDLPSRVYGSGFHDLSKVTDCTKEDITHPWNLNNLPLNEKGILRYLSEDSDSITKPRLTVSMMHSVLSWGLEDHFLCAADYLHLGASKVWYFISPEDQIKYENLLKSKIREYESSVGEKNLEGFSESMSNDILDGIKQSDTFTKRAFATNSKFDKFYEHEMHEVRLNSDFLLTPEILRENGIRVHYVIQKPGEFVIKLPSTYSASVSLGGSLSEKVNFGTFNWFDYAARSSIWMLNQKILPAFSVLKLLIGIIEETRDSAVLKKVSPLYDALLAREIQLRGELKAKVPNLRVVHNKFDFIADDSLRDSFPTKMVVYDGDDNFSLDPYNYISFWHEKSKDLRVEMHIYHSDDKLRSFQRTLATFAQSPDDWILKLDELLNSNSKPPLKVLKGLYQEGEKLPFDVPQLHDLKSYIDNASAWVDKAQELLNSKQKNRIRNRRQIKEDIEEKEYEAKILEDLSKEIPKLTFTCPEIDQLQELCAEISQYEASVRTFLSEQDHTIEEFYDMIDLGKSFGIKLISVEFLERIASRLDWRRRVADVLGTSTNLNDYCDLLEQGYGICGERDDGLLTILKQKIKNGRFLGARMKYELSSPKFTITEINELYDRVKGVPIDPEILQQLSNMKEQHLKAVEERDELHRTITKNSANLSKLRSEREKKIRNDESFDREAYYEQLKNFLGDKRDQRPLYSKAKDVLDRSRGILLMSPSSPIDYYLRQVEEWLRKTKRLFGKTNAPFSVLRNHLQNLLDKATSPFNLQDAYVPPESKVDDHGFFCLCRRMESGVMIQCEKCAEWYHCRCLKIGRGKRNVDDYICPVCDYRVDIPREYNSPTIDELETIVTDGALLDLAPDELHIITSIWMAADRFRAFMREILKWDGDQIVETDISKIKFCLRKLEGSCVLISDEYNQLRRLVWELSPVCDAPPPAVLKTSKTKRKVKKAEGEIASRGSSVTATEQGTPNLPNISEPVEGLSSDVVPESSCAKEDTMEVIPELKQEDETKEVNSSTEGQ